MGPPL